MSSYFISDVHLGLESKQREKQKEDRLLAFFKTILPSAENLFIVGDLFDFWFEYTTVIPKGFHRTLTALQEFTDRGTKVHYLVGNHDCWMKDFFTSELMIAVYAEPFETAVDGKRVYLHHGDGLAKNDLGYKLIKPILRNKFNVWFYRWLHPDIGVRIAKGSSRSSREYSSTKQYGDEDGMIQHATEKIRQGVDIVVMGHHHRANIIHIDQGTYINLGDWISQNTYAELTQGVITLKTWNRV